MKNNENIPPIGLIFSPIPIDQLAAEIFRLSEENRKVHSMDQVHANTNDDLISIEQACEHLQRSRVSIRKYIKEGKLRVHYFDKKSPRFLRSELMEDFKSLPGFKQSNP